MTVTAPILAGLTRLAEVGSTNDWLIERADTLGDGDWVIAGRQTAGRGRRGRAWSDGAGNLMASVLVKLQPGEAAAQQLSFVAALALWDALVPLVASDRLKLKWPNDLLLDGAKASGILLERQGGAIVIGFGVNIASAPDLPDRATVSLAAAGAAVPTPAALLDRLAEAFAARRGEWRTQGFAAIRDHWLARAAGLGEPIVARFGEEALTGRFEGLDADGALALRLADGRLRAVHAGEVFAL